MKHLLMTCCLVATSCYVHPYEVCNGIDDDHDPETVDGAEEPDLGLACDGPDADQCGEGSMVCVDGKLTCNDATSDSLEQCNRVDDDCNGMVDEGFDLAVDPVNCGACDHACTNANGGIACVAGTCTPTCANGAVDCNSDPDDGCEVFRDRNPTCQELADDMLAVSGDTGGTDELTGTDEAIVQVVLGEVSTTSAPITGTIELQVPAGLDYDLVVYCKSCGGAIMGTSRNPAGMTERVSFRANDVPNVNSDQTVYVEIRFVSETTCATPWKLVVTGGVTVAETTCGA